MAKYIDQQIPHYYDLYPTEEDAMGTHFLHEQLVHYLMDVLKWLFRGQTYALCANLNFYHTDQWEEYPLAPDIALIKGIEQQEVGSWNIGITGPAPQVVFEIASKSTWDKDLDEKPSRYALVGIEEYFAYDPHTPFVEAQCIAPVETRLYGWQLDKATGRMQAMTLDSDGSLWSQELESFLVPDGQYLRLYDRNGLLRLTGEEAETRRADAEALAKWVEARRADAEALAKWVEARRADAEVQARLAETRRADAEALAKLAEARRADAETKRANAEKKRAEALAEKLRSLGIDPNQIESV